jgi:hypothetical protein
VATAALVTGPTTEGETASIVGWDWSIEGDVWQLAGLWTDQVVVGGAGSLGNGLEL